MGFECVMWRRCVSVSFVYVIWRYVGYVYMWLGGVICICYLKMACLYVIWIWCVDMLFRDVFVYVICICPFHMLFEYVMCIYYLYMWWRSVTWVCYVYMLCAYVSGTCYSDMWCVYVMLGMIFDYVICICYVYMFGVYVFVDMSFDDVIFICYMSMLFWDVILGVIRRCYLLMFFMCFLNM